MFDGALYPLMSVGCLLNGKKDILMLEKIFDEEVDSTWGQQKIAVSRFL